MGTSCMNVIEDENQVAHFLICIHLLSIYFLMMFSLPASDRKKTGLSDVGFFYFKHAELIVIGPYNELTVTSCCCSYSSGLFHQRELRLIVHEY